jgi:hypothetical protein
LYARKRGVESFENKYKDFERGKSEEKNVCMEKKEKKNGKVKTKKYMCMSD